MPFLSVVPFGDLPPNLAVVLAARPVRFGSSVNTPE
jgi:hypothetical protein